MRPVEVVGVAMAKCWLDRHWQQYKYNQHKVHDAYNLNKSSVERPRLDAGSVA